MLPGRRRGSFRGFIMKAFAIAAGALLAGLASPAFAASSCADVAGKIYVYEIKGSTKPGATLQPYAMVGRIVLGASGSGVANSFTNGPGAVAGFRDDKVSCANVPGQPPKLAFTGPAGNFELRFHTRGTTQELSLMRDDKLQAADGEAIYDRPPAQGARYDACAAANGVFVGSASGPIPGANATAALARYAFVAGAGPVSYLIEQANTAVAFVNQRVTCKIANAAGAGRITFLGASGPVGSAIVYSTALGNRFAIAEERVGSPDAGWLFKQP